MPKPNQWSVYLKQLRSEFFGDLRILLLQFVLHARPTTLTLSSEQHTSRSCCLLSPGRGQPQKPNTSSLLLLSQNTMLRTH